MRTSRTTLLLAVSAAVSLAGCGKTPGQPAPPAPAAASAPATAPAAASPSAELAAATAFAARLRSDRDGVLSEIGRLEYDVHRKLLTVSGLEDELGGAQATDRALRALMLEMKRITAGWQPPQWTPIQNETVEGSLGVAQAAVELTGLALGFDDLYGKGEPLKVVQKTKESASTLDVLDGVIDYSSALETNESNLRGKFATRMKINVCPDANGVLKVELDSKSALARAGGGGTDVTIKVIVTRQLDDDAQYASLEKQTHVEQRTYGARAATFVDVTMRTPNAGAPSTTVNLRSSQATDANVQTAEDLARILELMAALYTENARAVWENGACVKLDPTTTPSQRTKAKPSTSFSVQAAPRSRVDGTATGGTVTARLSGDSSLDPAGSKVRADAKFTYVAPDERKKSAKVSFESRSKRGIGKSELAFDTNEGAAYSAEGGADEFHGTGKICDLAAPFTIAGSGNTVRFVPRDASGGSYDYSGTMSGFGVFGNGTYTVKYADDVAVSITATGPGSVKTPHGVMTRTGTEEYRLTPLQDCAAGTP
jgi:hypothetical protein